MKSQNQRLGPFGARFGARSITIKKNGLTAESDETSTGGLFEGMGDTGIEPVTISL